MIIIKKVVAELTEDAHTRFKTICAQRGVNMKDVLAQMIERYINEQEFGNEFNDLNKEVNDAS